MRKKVYLSVLSMLLIFSAIFILYTGCSKKEETSENKSSEESGKKTPEEMTKLESDIVNIIKSVDKEDEDEKEKSEFEIKTTIETKNEQEEDADKSETEIEKKISQEIKKESTTDKKWESIDKKSKDIHKKWNNLKPELIKAGVGKNNIDSFSDALNTLTMHVEAKDQIAVLLAANHLYGIVPEFMDKFQNDVPPDLKRTVYLIREAKYKGMTNQWENATVDIENSKSHFSIIKGALEKDKDDLGSKTELSIQELEKVVRMNNMTLTKLKSEIVIDNLEKVEEAVKK